MVSNTSKYESIKKRQQQNLLTTKSRNSLYRFNDMGKTKAESTMELPRFPEVSAEFKKDGKIMEKLSFCKQ